MYSQYVFGLFVCLVMALSANNAQCNDTAKSIIGYFDSTSLTADDADITQLDLTPFDYVIYRHANALSDGTVVPGDEFVDLHLNLPTSKKEPVQGRYRALKHQAELKGQASLLLSIGGPEFSGHFSAISGNSQYLASFISSTLDTLERFDFKGIEIDWRYPKDASRLSERQLIEHFANYPLMIEAFKAACSQCTLAISVPAQAAHHASWDFGTMAANVDFFIVHTDQLFGQHTPKTGPQTPLYAESAGSKISIDDSIKRLTRLGIPADKLVVTVSGTGMSWRGVKNQNHGLLQTHKGPALGTWDQSLSSASGHLSHSAIDTLIDVGQLEQHWSFDSKTHYAYSAEDQQFVSYESTRSLHKKLNYIDDNNLYGLAISQISHLANTPDGLSHYAHHYYHAALPFWPHLVHLICVTIPCVLMPLFSGFGLSMLIAGALVLANHKRSRSKRFAKETTLLPSLKSLPQNINQVIKYCSHPPASILRKLPPENAKLFDDISRQSLIVQEQINRISQCTLPSSLNMQNNPDTSSQHDSLKALTRFTQIIKSESNFESLLNSLFDFLSNDPRIDALALYSDQQLLRSHGQDAPSKKLSLTSPNCDKNTLHLDGSRQAGHIAGQDFGDFEFNLSFSAPLSDSEEVYFHNLCQQISLVRGQIQGLLNQPQMLGELHEIARRKDSLLFIKGEKGYSGIHSSEESRPTLVYLSLRALQAYFPERLIQVHRSYLINPAMVSGSQKQRYNHELILRNGQIIPISRGYLGSIKARYPNWFEKSATTSLEQNTSKNSKPTYSTHGG